MGDSLSWLVTKGSSLESLCKLLGVTKENNGSKLNLCGSLTADDQLFLFETRWRKWTFQQIEERAKLSAGREIYFCMKEDHVMASSVTFWSMGKQVWSVEHDSQKGVFHVATAGHLPSSFDGIKAKRFAEQQREGGESARVDYIIQIPMDLAQAFTGYDGELDTPGGEYLEFFEKKNSLFERLFGKPGRQG